MVAHNVFLWPKLVSHEEEKWEVYLFFFPSFIPAFFFFHLFLARFDGLETTQKSKEVVEAVMEHNAPVSNPFATMLLL